MTNEPQQVAPGAARRDSKDGRAAVAIALLTVALIAWAIYNIV